jgi:hypothetical protein
MNELAIAVLLDQLLDNVMFKEGSLFSVGFPYAGYV